MTEDILTQIIENLRSTLQMDEFTDISNYGQFRAFIRYSMKNGITEGILFCTSLEVKVL